MTVNILLIVLSVTAGYVLGSIPSAYIIGRAFKGIDITEVGDGHIGMAYTYRRVGLWGAAVVGIMDVSKGVASIALAQLLALPVPVVVITGVAAVTGHNWSLFLRFKGGKGALAMYGVLVILVSWELFIALAVGGLFYLFIRKSGLATGVLVVFLAVFHWFVSRGGAGSLTTRIMISLTPILLSLPMIMKNVLMARSDMVEVTRIEKVSDK
jgi:acyl phosphate:glycerol-3-phosphate acyltransferase